MEDKFLEQMKDYAEGTCRDINFPSVAEREFLSLGTSLSSCYEKDVESVCFNNTDGEPVPYENRIRDGEFLYERWRSDSMKISAFELRVDGVSGDLIDIEVTLWPDEILRASFEDVTDFLSLFLKSFSCKDYYVRYENASWKFGDTGAGSSMIFSHKDIAL